MIYFIRRFSLLLAHHLFYYKQVNEHKSIKVKENYVKLLDFIYCDSLC